MTYLLCTIGGYNEVAAQNFVQKELCDVSKDRVRL
jgi:hypothetical protein